jgi:hypothetical protein
VGVPLRSQHDEPQGRGAVVLNKDIRRLAKEIRASGYRIERRKSGHYAIVDRHGRLRGVLPSTPSDHRALKNLETQLRRAGVVTRRTYRKP